MAISEADITAMGQAAQQSLALVKNLVVDLRKVQMTLARIEAEVRGRTPGTQYQSKPATSAAKGGS